MSVTSMSIIGFNVKYATFCPVVLFSEQTTVVLINANDLSSRQKKVLRLMGWKALNYGFLMERVFILFLYTLGNSTATKTSRWKYMGRVFILPTLKYSTIESNNVNSSSLLAYGNAGLSRPYWGHGKKSHHESSYFISRFNCYASPSRVLPKFPSNRLLFLFTRM
jgi:hypothetical protein